MRKFLWLIALAFAAGLAPTVLRADTVYTYAGNNFTSVSGPYTTAMSVSGSFALASPFAADFSGGIAPLSFNFSDGVQTLTNLNTEPFSSIYIQTDANAQILRWEIALHTPSGSIISDNGTIALDEGGVINALGLSQRGGNVEIPGSWSISTAVPEIDPTYSTSAIVLILCSALIIRGRRKIPAA